MQAAQQQYGASGPRRLIFAKLPAATCQRRGVGLLREPGWPEAGEGSSTRDPERAVFCTEYTGCWGSGVALRGPCS